MKLLYSFSELSTKKKRKIIKKFLPKLWMIEYTRIVKKDIKEVAFCPNVPSLVGRNFFYYDYMYMSGKNGGVFSFGVTDRLGFNLLDLQYIVSKEPRNGFGTFVINYLSERYPNHLFLINAIDAAVPFYEKLGFKKLCLAKRWEYLKDFTKDAFSQPNSWIMVKQPKMELKFVVMI